MRNDLLHMPAEDLAAHLAAAAGPAVGPDAAPALLRCLDDDALPIRRDAAKTLRHLAARRPDLVQPWAAEILDRLERGQEAHPLWQLLAACWPLRWTGPAGDTPGQISAHTAGQIDGDTSAARAMAVFQKCFDEGRSKAVGANALQAMIETAHQHPVYRDDVRKLAAFCLTCGIPALAARARQMRRRFKDWLLHEAEG